MNILIFIFGKVKLVWFYKVLVFLQRMETRGTPCWCHHKISENEHHTWCHNIGSRKYALAVFDWKIHLLVLNQHKRRLNVSLNISWPQLSKILPSFSIKFLFSCVSALLLEPAKSHGSRLHVQRSEISTEQTPWKQNFNFQQNSFVLSLII